MKRIVMPLALFALGLVVFESSPHGQAAVPPLKAEALRDWIGMKDRMMKIADAMPPEEFGYKSTPPQRSYGEQIMHVVTVNNNVLQLLRPTTPRPVTNPSASTKAEILKALADSFDWGTVTLREQTDDTMAHVEQVPDVLKFLGPSTRSRLVSFLLGHTWDIYGQMAVYLRLNGLVPPASATP